MDLVERRRDQILSRQNKIQVLPFGTFWNLKKIIFHSWLVILSDAKHGIWKEDCTEMVGTDLEFLI